MTALEFTAPLTCEDCECRTGEQGAINVTAREIGGFMAIRCAECAIYAEEEASIGYATERDFFS